MKISMTGESRIHLDSSTYAGLSALFDDPRRDLTPETLALADTIRADWSEASRCLSAFASAFAELSDIEREETWLSTFACAPSCVPNIGVHLYGEESFKRGELLAKLKDGFAPHEFSSEDELPDHLGVLLAFAARLKELERDELEYYMLAGPVEAMAKTLAETENPYRFLVDAVAAIVCRHGVPQEIRELMSGGGREAWSGSEACGTCAGSAVGANGQSDPDSSEHTGEHDG